MPASDNERLVEPAEVDAAVEFFRDATARSERSANAAERDVNRGWIVRVSERAQAIDIEKIRQPPLRDVLKDIRFIQAQQQDLVALDDGDGVGRYDERGPPVGVEARSWERRLPRTGRFG